MRSILVVLIMCLLIPVVLADNEYNMYYTGNVININGVKTMYNAVLIDVRTQPRAIYAAHAVNTLDSRVVYGINIFTGDNLYSVTMPPPPPPSGDEGSGGGNGGAQPPSGGGSGSGDGSGGSSGWNPGSGSWNGSWDPVPWWAKEWTSKNVRDYIRYPFRILVEMVGLQLLSAVVYGVIMFATFMHTKSAFATGVVSMIMATAMVIVLPELVWVSYVALAFGIAAVIYEVAKKVV